MRRSVLAVAGLAFGASVAFAQVPDVAPFLELHPSWQVRSTKKSLFEWNDPMGRYSLVGLRMILEPGYRVYVAQRFQKIDGTGDPDTMDEYYVENRGHWRLGKQYLPFGRREILKSTVLAARFDTDLLFDALPLSIAACDGGSGRTRGVVAHIGGPIGISLAFGNHLGIQGTDLSKFRYLEEAPGIGRGHRFAIGGDTTTSLGSAQLSLEWTSLRRGETDLDTDKDLSDVRLRYKLPGTQYRANMGWSRDWSDRKDFLTFEFDLQDNSKISYMPMLRMEGLTFHDFGFSAVFRL